MAKEFMDQGVASFQIADPMRGERAPTQDEVECHEATRPSALISPGLESNPDSCYDSDSSSVGSNCNGTADADEHDNISRTTSDTLAAERSETDTPKMDIVSAGRPAIISTDINPNSNTSIMGGDDDDVEPGGGKPPTQFASNVEYAAKVEFGLRLGYTEDQIFRALDKVGYKISEDELLAELIKISDLTERSDDSDDSVSDVNVGLDKFRIGDVDNDPEELRPIVVDGSNVAMSHGNNIVFSCAGIKLAVDWFRERGHKEITVFVPTWRKEASCYGTPITEQDILLDLEKDKVVVFTPARRVAGKRVICYDDRYIIKLAAENGGIVVSNDNYRDLIDENPDYKKVVDERLLMYSFVNDRFMPPDDPLGRYGPSLTDFLRKYPASSRCLPLACPYGKKCTYGNKCKYYHPERGQQPVKLINEKLIEKACKKIKEVKEKGHLGSAEKKTKRNVEKPVKKLPLTRTKSQTPAPQKKALTHTRSLQPNHSAVQSKPKSSSDFMQPESGGKFSKEVKDMVVKISVTTEFDSDNYHRYNNKLSELRQKVHDAEALGSSCQTPGEAVRRQDGDWMKDVVKEKRPLSSWAVPHKDLHPEFGDAQASFANGHLALAKKLSDEGNSGDNHRHNTGTHCLSPRKARLDVGPKLVQSQGQPPVRGHMTLQRQLSLKGSDDPRLSHGLGANYHGMSMVQAEENQQCPPSAQAGQSHWSRQGHNLLAKRASCPLVTVPARSRDCSPRPGVLSQCIPQHPQLTDCYINHVYDNNVTSSCDQNSLAAQQPMAEHLPLHRLKSDPLVPQNGARAHGLVNKFTEMSRQNSTSDPQLSSHQEEPDWCCSPDIAPGSDTNDLFMGIPRESVLGIPLHIRTAPNSPHIPMSPHLSQKSFPFKHSLGTLHLKDSHGSYPDVYASTSLAQVMQCSASNLQSGVSAQSIASYHMSKPLPSEVNGNSGFFLSGQSKPPQMMMPGLVQDHSKPSPVFSQPAYQPSTSQHIMTQIPPQMSTAVQQQQHALIGANGPVPVIVRDCAVTQTMNLTRAPQSCARGVARDMFWPSSQADPCIGQTDARHKLYYHLCALFKEEQVKRVMSEHPNETNPQVLCKYLISR